MENQETKQLTDVELQNIKNIKVFTIIEYLEQQIQFIAENYKETYLAYQQSKLNQPQITKHEESVK